MKTTQREIKNYNAKDITYIGYREGQALKEQEGGFRLIAFSCGIYGVNGQVLQGLKSGKLYKITSRTQAIYLY